MGLGKKGEGIKPREKKIQLIDTDNSMMITTGKGEWGEVKEGRGGKNGDGRGLDLGW